MTLFRSGETRADPFENPSVPLSSIGLDTVFGMSSNNDSDAIVTSDTALAVATVYRCIGLLSTVIAGCTLKTYRNPGKKQIFPSLLDPGNQNTRYTQFELMELIVVHLCLAGNAYVYKKRGPGPDGPNTGVIIDLIPINPKRVTVRIDKESGEKVFLIKCANTDGSNMPKGKGNPQAKTLTLTTFDIMHIMGMGDDGTLGLAPIEKAAQAIGTALQGDKLAAKFFANGSQLSGILQVKHALKDQKQADKIRERWLSKNGGTNHAAEVAVLDAETTFEPLTIAPDQLQFLESRRWQTTEIARLFGIPPHLVGDVEKSTSWGTGIEQQNVGFVSYTVSGYTNRIQQRFTREVISTNKQYCEFDTDKLTRGSMQERYESYNTAVTGGWMTRNEARVKENMEPIEGLDEPLLPLNMAPANAPDETQLPNTDPPSPDDSDTDPQ